MTIEDQIRDETIQYDINGEAAKTSALSLGKIDKYEYFTCEQILLSNQQKVFQQDKFNYAPIGKAFEKQTKTIENQGEKNDALKSLKSLKPKEVKPEETKPINYDDYFINRMAEIRDEANKLILIISHIFLRVKLPQQILLVLKVQYMFLKAYIVVI